MLVAVADVPADAGGAGEAGVAAGDDEVAIDRPGDESVAAEDEDVAADVSVDPGVAAGDEDALDGFGRRHVDVADDDDDRVVGIPGGPRARSGRERQREDRQKRDYERGGPLHTPQPNPREGP